MKRDPSKVYANPFLVCEECGHRVVGADVDADNRFLNVPCGHGADFNSACPSWSPVDGCQCLAVLGRVDHAEPT